MLDTDYARQLKQLLPQGVATQFESTSWLAKTLLALAGELARVDLRVQNMLAEWDPRTALETLPDWEKVLGLPDSCLTTIPASITERRAAIVSKYTSQGGQSVSYFVQVAANLGYVVTITEYVNLVARSGRMRSGDRCYDIDWSYVWQVNLPVSTPSAGIRFRAGTGRSGDRLSGYGTLDIQCVIKRLAPAQTIVLFSFT